MFQRFYDDGNDCNRRVADLALNAFEEDEYRILVDRINQTPPDDAAKLANTRREWGLHKVAEVTARARQRLAVVDAFEKLASDPATPELSGVHKALEANPWLAGDECELWRSDRTLLSIVAKVSERTLGERIARKRPDLILVGLQDRFLLIELKRPSYGQRPAARS